MNPTDLIIGLGLGILITLIVRVVVDSKNERDKQIQDKHFQLSERIKTLDNKVIDHHYDHLELKKRIEKLEQFKKDSELSLPIVADRLETLEKRRK